MCFVGALVVACSDSAVGFSVAVSKTALHDMWELGYLSLVSEVSSLARYVSKSSKTVKTTLNYMGGCQN